MIREGKSLEVGQRVKVYRNLNKPDFFSICDLRTGLVVAYAKAVELTDIEKFHVSEKSRQRVLKEKKRNVHAWILGRFYGTLPPVPGMKIAYYNPYQTACFVEMNSKREVVSAKRVVCFDKYAFYE